MNIALIGEGITNLVLAKILTKKNIKVSLFFVKKNSNNQFSRTIGISKNNIEFFKNNNLDLTKISWPINSIKIFNELSKKYEILNFNNNQGHLFSLVKNNDLYYLLEKDLKKKKLFSRFEIKSDVIYEKILKNNKFDLIINTDAKNKISRKFFYKKINKDYNSFAYTAFIKHKKCKNNVATQIFTKKGPLAFLPYAKNQTSIVFSIMDHKKELSKLDIEKLINEYNNYYKITSFSKFEKFKLNFSAARNYYYNNVLSFGDNLHKIHPLAGQGFNMTLRDIQILEDLIDFRLDLGLPLDKSVLKDFESKTKHLNYIFSSGIDFIHEFFKFENKFGNNYTKQIIKHLGKNKLFNQYISNFADRGLFF